MFGGGRTGYREGGTRGGRDQFNWDSVKQDRFRDYYLGASLKTADDKTLWYTRTTEHDAARLDEIAAIRAAEAAAMREALCVENVSRM